MHTTITKLRERDTDDDVLERMSKAYTDDAPIKISAILASNGLADALECLRGVDGYDKEIRLYAVWCARQVQHLMPDKRSLAALDVAERHAYGRASDAELDAAGAAAWAAAEAAWGAAKGAADVARDAAWDAALAARDAAWGAAWAAALAAAGAARSAAGAARDAARDAARSAQAAKLCEVCELIEVEHVHNS